jgi:transcriptional regulator with XRE-family HTH domain
MARSKRHPTAIAGDREAVALAATLGGVVRTARVRQRLRLIDIADRTGLSVTRLSGVERGLGATLPLGTWVRLGLAIDQPLAVRFSSPIEPDRLADAGHLELQEWVLAIARRHGWHAGLEIPTRAVDPRHSADVLIRAGIVLILIECWNNIGDFGAALRSTSRKLAELADLAVATGAERVSACWLVRPTAANRGLVRAYPEAIRARLTGSSWGWVRALEGPGSPPDQPGFAWLDARAGLRSLRIRVR